MSGCLSGRAALAGVMGWPVGHSLSPRLHAFWLRQHRQGPAFAPGSGSIPR
jgi:shikimate dehydrogenase